MSNPSSLLERAARPAEWTPLPNGRLGLPLLGVSKKREVYLAADGKTRLCAHGVCSSGGIWCRSSGAHPRLPLVRPLEDRAQRQLKRALPVEKVEAAASHPDVPRPGQRIGLCTRQ